MHKDFHLYGTFLAAAVAGYSVDDALEIAFAAQKVDEFEQGRAAECYTVTPMFSAVAKAIWDIYKSQNVENALEISDTWMSFHFVPMEPVGVSAEEDSSKRFACGDGNPMAQICEKLIPGQEDQDDIINLERIGITMHVLADSYAHQEFAGITCFNPRIVKNIEVLYGEQKEGLGTFDHIPVYISKWLSGCCYFGHGSAGHIPDLSWVEYNYWWTEEAEADQSGKRVDWRSNPDIFTAAFLRMVDIMVRIRGNRPRESEQPFLPEQLYDFLQSSAVKIRRRYSDILDWNQAVRNAEAIIPLDIKCKQNERESLSAIETQRYMAAGRTPILLHQYDESGEYRVSEVAAEALWGNTVKSNSFGEDSDTLFAQFYDQVKKPHWLPVKKMADEYHKYLKNKRRDPAFEAAAAKHKNAVYRAVGMDKEGLKALLEQEF